MSHGDLTPGNVLTAGGHLAGVLDVGSYGAADPALDLISAWNLLEAGPRQVLRTALRCTNLEWERSKAWAFQQAMGLVWYYADSNPVMSRLGQTTLDRIMSAAEDLPEPLRAEDAQRLPVPLLKRRVADGCPGTEDGDLGRVEEDGRRQLVPDAANGTHTNIVLRCKEGSSTREAVCNRPALRHAPPDHRQPEDDLRHLQN